MKSTLAKILLRAAFCLPLVSAPLSARAHADLHVQIEDVTNQIKTQPTNAELFLRRGELHRAHTNWDAAQVDFDRAASLNPGLAPVDLARGKMFLEAHWPMSAQAALDRFLSRQPNHADALATRARVMFKLGQNLAAAQDYSQAITHSIDPKPELYLERAQVLMTEGGAHLQTALQGLDEGIKKIGPLVTLQLYAIDIEIKLKRFDAALARLERVAAQSPRKETWLARRGEILQQAGRDKEAREAFQAAVTAINSLPDSRRRVPAMVELEKRLRQALEHPTTGKKVEKPGK